MKNWLAGCKAPALPSGAAPGIKNAGCKSTLVYWICTWSCKAVYDKAFHPIQNSESAGESAKTKQHANNHTHCSCQSWTITIAPAIARLGVCATLEGGPSGGFAGEGMKAAADAAEASDAPGFGAANPAAAYRAAAPLIAPESLLLQNADGILCQGLTGSKRRCSCALKGSAACTRSTSRIPRAPHVYRLPICYPNNQA